MTEANLGATHNNYHHQVYRFNDRSDLSDDNPRVSLDPARAARRAIAGDRRRAARLGTTSMLFSGGMPDDDAHS